MSQRKSRIQHEVALLKTLGLQVEWDAEEGAWVQIRALRLPAGLGREQTDLLLLIPNDYPRTPPSGIYVAQGLRLPDHYFEYKGTHNPLGDKGWAWYCFHVNGHSGGWRASTRLLAGDNLAKYMQLTQALMEKSVSHN